MCLCGDSQGHAPHGFETPCKPGRFATRAVQIDARMRAQPPDKNDLRGCARFLCLLGRARVRAPSTSDGLHAGRVSVDCLRFFVLVGEGSRASALNQRWLARRPRVRQNYLIEHITHLLENITHLIETHYTSSRTHCECLHTCYFKTHGHRYPAP